MVRTTRAQREAIFKVFQRDFPGWVTPTTRMAEKPCPRCGYCGGLVKVPSSQYRRFRKSVLGTSMNCVMLPWKGMWLGIELDGYTHS